MPRERFSVRECGVRRQGLGLKFLDCAIAFAGSACRWPVASSMKIERFIGRDWMFSSSAAVRRIDCKATFDFFF